MPIAAFQISDPAHAYVSLVKDRFHNISEQLANRLGQANWQRHEELRLVASDVHIPSQPALSIAQTTFVDSGYQSDKSRLSLYATSVKSHTSHSSFKSTGSAIDTGRSRVPPAPEAVRTGREPCPYCHELIKISSRVDWK